MNDVVSEPIEDLRLISDAEFEFVQHALKNRILHRYDSRRELENGIIEEGRTKTSVYGATLLSVFFIAVIATKNLLEAIV